MKIFNKFSAIVIAVALTVGLVWLIGAIAAATTPSLGTAGTYGILASTFTRNIAVTSITGDLGYTTLSGGGTHTVTGSTNIGGGAGDAAYQLAGTDQAAALVDLNSQPCGNGTTIPGYTFAAGAIDLATDTTHGTIGIYTPGVYCTQTAAGAMSIGTAGITLNGAGTYIFRTSGPTNALTSVTGSSVNLTNGASACDVFWTPTAATTLAANTTFTGTIIDAAGITVGNLVTWVGRALAFGGTVTTDTDTISVPTGCAAAAVAAPAGASQRYGSINVVKTVINDSGGTKTIADFPLYLNGAQVFSGVTNTFPAPAGYFVMEYADPKYTTTFSGDCDKSGLVNLNSGDNKFCIVTNNDIGVPVVPIVPPLIDLVKTANPLSLPSGPGSVVYSYTLRNIGTVPVTDVTIVGDTCSPIVRNSGDTNGDNKLDTNETWVYTCSKTLSATHTNTAVATGWANGISAVDVASATVIVGAPIVPPLIHVTKIPNPLALSVGGGMVTYIEKVTNPGTVALSNIRLTDDKCSNVRYNSGDTNGNSKLETTETWTYACSTKLTQTTTNTVTATGDANGMTAKDIAVAHVIVASPKLPNTGAGSNDENNIPWNIIIPIGILAGSILFYFIRRKQTN